MATLGNVDGRSLVPNIGRGIGSLAQSVTAGIQKSQEEARNQELLELSGIASGEGQQGATPTEQGESPQSVADDAMRQIFLLDPVFGKNVQDLADRRDKREIAESERIIEFGAKNAALIEGIDGDAQQLKAIKSVITDISLEAGNDQAKEARINNWVEIANKSPLERNIALMKMQVLGTATKTVLAEATKSRDIEETQVKQGIINQLEGMRNDEPAIQTEKLQRLGRELTQRGEDTREVVAALRAPTDPNLVGNRNDLIDQFLTRNRTAEEAATIRKEGRQEARDIAKEGRVAGRVEPVPFTTIGKARKDLRAGLITQNEFKTLQKTPPDFKTSVGKLFGDQKLVIAEFGADSPQATAMREAINAESEGEGPNLKDIGGMRKEFTKLSGDFIKIRDAFKRVDAAGKDPSAAGDLALIFNFMKILDPGSVVRESEFATAANSAGVPDRIRNQYNKVVSGQRLAQNQRKDFINTAEKLFIGQRESQEALERSFNTLAASAKFKPEDVSVDFIGEFRPTGKGTKTIGRFTVEVE